MKALASKLFGVGPGLRAILGVAAALLVGLLPCETQNAVANGDTRTIQLYHAHTKESITATFLVDGSYDQSVLDKLNWFLRDWRRDEATKMDPRLFDVIWEVYRESGSHQPIQVMSAYRSPETNAMLRRRSRGVAEHSQHILGKAMDQHYVDVPMSRIREIAMRLQRGGVGFYPTAGTPFVHMDVGGVRHWPRMSYDQLAQLFPDGKTVHIPSNGQPLPGYELARAELESRGDGESYPTVGQIKSKGFFAWLFGGSDEDEDVASEGGRAGKTSSPRNTRVAVADRGGSDAPAVYGGTGKDGGARSFMVSEQNRQAAQASPFGRVAQPAPPPPSQAEATLAQAMSAPPPTPATTPASAPVQAVPDLPVATQALASNGLLVPVPPRRPVELASNDGLPMPPVRPVELSRPAEGPAPGPAARGKVDAIGQFLSGRTASLGLPAGITQGGSAAGSYQALAYAGDMPKPAFRSVSDVPLPVARPPELVGARLDRGNFRSLTSMAKTDRAPTVSSLGASFGARAASRANAGPFATAPLVTRFGSKASELTTERFSGNAVRTDEKLVTARRAEASGRPSAD